jgi:uncharacterized membrane protein (DUF4010 family)
MANRSRTDPALAAPSAAGAIASLFASLSYMLALVAAVSPSLLPRLALPLAAAAVAMLSYTALLGRRPAAGAGETAPPGRAFNFGQALLFVAIVVGCAVISRPLTAYFGVGGALIGAGLTGVADAHAAAAAMATLYGSHQIDQAAATLGVLAGLSVNMIIKAPVAFTLGSRGYAARVTIGIVLMLACLWVGFALNAAIFPAEAGAHGLTPRA